MKQSYMPHYIALLKPARPLILTQAGQMTGHLIDNAMVGHVGATELAAASFANSIYIASYSELPADIRQNEVSGNGADGGWVCDASGAHRHAGSSICGIHAPGIHPALL